MAEGRASRGMYQDDKKNPLTWGEAGKFLTGQIFIGGENRELIDGVYGVVVNNYEGKFINGLYPGVLPEPETVVDQDSLNLVMKILEKRFF